MLAYDLYQNPKVLEMGALTHAHTFVHVLVHIQGIGCNMLAYDLYQYPKVLEMGALTHAHTYVHVRVHAQGIGCNVLAYDLYQNPKVLEMGVQYLSMEELLPKCDIITLHCPLLPSTYHMINKLT